MVKTTDSADKDHSEQELPMHSTTTNAKSCLSVLLSLGELGLVYWATTTNLIGPTNLVELISALNVILIPLILFALVSARDKESRPKWTRITIGACEVTCVLLLAWNGWWWCGVSYSLGGFASALWRNRPGSAASTSQARGDDGSKKNPDL